MNYDLDIIQKGPQSAKVRCLVGRGRTLDDVNVDILQEFSVFVRTSDFSWADVRRWMRGIDKNFYYAAKRIRFYGDVDMIADNVKSITSSDAWELLLRLTASGARTSGKVPYLCRQEILKRNLGGTDRKDLAEELGVTSHRLTALMLGRGSRR